MRTRAATVFCIYRFVSSTAATSFPEISLSFRGGASKKMSTNRIDAPSPNRYVTVGGGAINEKKRNIKETNGTKSERISGFNPIKSKSHLMHAIEGMDRYPNYLSRWSEQDMDRLEEGLEHQLQKVRAQKIDVMERRRGIEVMVMRLVEQNEEWSQLLKPPEAWSDVCDEILDSRAATAIFKSKQFACCSKQPTVKQVLNGDVVIQLNPYLLEELMEEEFFDVYSLPLLSIEFCDKLRTFVQELSQLAATDEFAHLQLGRTDLDTVGLSWINDLLFQLVVRPISRHLFRQTELERGELDYRHGYVVGYKAKPTMSAPRERLVAHTDDSEVTLNLCIGDEFDGGALNFRGLRGTEGAGQEIIGTFEPRLGTALLHAGRHFHEVTQVTTGNRYMYIMWARSWSSTRGKVCPCCYLNRRQDNSCCCGPRWN
jgi:hypothetical protein